MRALRPVFLAVSLASAVPSAATATIYTYTVTGMTTNDVEDVYGYEGATLPVGAAFTLTYRVDDGLPTATYAYSPLASSADGGGRFNNGALPPLAATLMVGGYSYTVRTGDLFQPYAIDSVGDPIGTQIDEGDHGTATKTLAAQTLTLDARYGRDDQCCGVFFGYADSSTDQLFVSLTSLGFASADYREVGTFDLTPASIGFFLTANQSFDRSGTYVNYESAGLAPTRLVVSADAVPEPAVWATMATGFAAIGFGRRSRRRSQANAEKNPCAV